MRVEPRIDPRRRQRIGRFERQRSRASRPQRADVGREAARRVQPPAVALEDPDAEVKLDVRRGQLRRRLEEAAGLRDVRREDAAPVAVVAQRAAERVRDVARHEADQVPAAAIRRQ